MFPVFANIRSATVIMSLFYDSDFLKCCLDSDSRRLYKNTSPKECNLLPFLDAGRSFFLLCQAYSRRLRPAHNRTRKQPRSPNGHFVFLVRAVGCLRCDGRIRRFIVRLERLQNAILEYPGELTGDGTGVFRHTHLYARPVTSK